MARGCPLARTGIAPAACAAAASLSDLHASVMRSGCRCETTRIGRREVVVRPDRDCRKHGLPPGVRLKARHLRAHALDGEDDRTVEARLYAEAMRPVYRYHWGNNPRRKELKGRRCVIVARGKLGTVLLRFLDTDELVTTSARSVRRIRRAGRRVATSSTSKGGT